MYIRKIPILSGKFFKILASFIYQFALCHRKILQIVLQAGKSVRNFPKNNLPEM
ncbi:Uncharacterized protein dnm_053550 [Desulfonema magnum]|uniref:Uncharacterized protein n=1 Tax=Desulfonema magnum TaxID=45655 RepID=A0A975BQP2_9BACT|nr:Uncharacterized protein dnm_053550 [Desulfonema magnum]